MVKQSTRILAGALMGALLFMLLALWFVVGTDEESTRVPSLPLLVALPAAGVVVHLLLDAIGYRAEPIAPGTPPEEASGQAVVRWQAAMMRRFVLAEAIAIVSIALCFVLESGGYVLTVIGCLTSLALMAVHVYPWSRPVTRLARSLERDGAESGLRETFGVAPARGGAVREL